MPFLERGLHADSLAAAMTDLEDQSGAALMTLTPSAHLSSLCPIFSDPIPTVH